MQTAPEAWLQAAVSRGTRSSGGMAKSMAEGEKMQVRNVSVSSESLNLSSHKSREPAMRLSLNPRPLLLVLVVSLAAVTLELGMRNTVVGTCFCLSWVFSSSFSPW